MVQLSDETEVAALDWGCGMTLDLFWSTPDASISVQWLWAAPLSRFSSNHHDESQVLEQVATVISRVGFHPVDTVTSHLLLPNGYSHEANCPFATNDCPGEHLVVSGAGLIAEHRVRDLARRVSGLLVGQRARGGGALDADQTALA